MDFGNQFIWITADCTIERMAFSVQNAISKINSVVFWNKSSHWTND